jgi:hypothetical protein
MTEKVEEFIAAIQREDNQKILEMLESEHVVLLVVEAKIKGFGGYLYDVVAPAMLGESKKQASTKRIIERLCRPASNAWTYLQEGSTQEREVKNA